MAEEPQSTADADAREVEEMVNSMLLDSPTPDAEKGSKKFSEETPARKVFVLFFPNFWICAIGFLQSKIFFSPGPQNQEDLVEKIEETPRVDATLVVGTNTSLASPGGAPPQVEKIKLVQEHFGLARKLLMVSSR